MHLVRKFRRLAVRIGLKVEPHSVLAENQSEHQAKQQVPRNI